MLLVVFLLSVLILSVIRRRLWKKLENWSASGPRFLDARLIRGLRGPAGLAVLVLSAFLAMQVDPARFEAISSARYALKIGLILVAIWSVDQVLAALLRSIRLPEGVTEGSRSLFSSLLRIGAFGLGLAIILDTLGVSIAPVLASLGVGSLAVALALQDTLGNFFAGVYLQFDRPIREGDFIKLEDGAEGYVLKIGWRSTQIRLLANNTIIIPNSKLSTSVLVNYDLPDRETAVLVQVGVAYGSNLTKVEQVTSRVGKEVQQRVEGAVSSFEPFVRFHTFGDSSVNFTVILRAKHWTDQYLLKHEFVKSLHEAYATESIEIPFPQRVIHMTGPALR